MVSLEVSLDEVVLIVDARLASNDHLDALKTITLIILLNALTPFKFSTIFVQIQSNSNKTIHLYTNNCPFSTYSLFFSHFTLFS